MSPFTELQFLFKRPFEFISTLIIIQFRNSAFRDTESERSCSSLIQLRIEYCQFP